jgi:hypothetical protein
MKTQGCTGHPFGTKLSRTNAARKGSQLAFQASSLLRSAARDLEYEISHK